MVIASHSVYRNHSVHSKSLARIRVHAATIRWNDRISYSFLPLVIETRDSKFAMRRYRASQQISIRYVLNYYLDEEPPLRHNGAKRGLQFRVWLVGLSVAEAGIEERQALPPSEIGGARYWCPDFAGSHRKKN